MALLKAFVCQVIILGIYKLFLEQIFEDYLVPDELTRNGLVGFVCLLCFGIQLYTDKAADDYGEAEEELKETTNTRKAECSKKYESAEISAAPEIITETSGLKTASRRMVTNIQTTSQGTASKSEIPAKDGQVAISEERSNIISSTDTEKVTLLSNSGIFAPFSTNKPDAIQNGKTDLLEETEVSVLNAETSYFQETTTIPVLNGLSEMNVHEESDDEGIEIDQFEIKEPVKKLSEPLATTEVEVIPESLTDTTAEFKCLSNQENVSSTQDSEKTTTLKTNDAETEMINNKAENLKSIDNKSSNINEETGSEKSMKDEAGVSQEATLLSQPDERTDTIKFLPSIQEMNNVNSTLNKAINAAENTNKNADSSTLVNAKVPSTIQKRKLSGEVCVAPITIDISFIYACH